jgi:hypothetical protein
MAAAALVACARRGLQTGGGVEAGSTASVVKAESTSGPSDAAVAPACGDAGEITIFVSPERPAKGRALQVVAVADRRIAGSLSLHGEVGAAAATVGAGPPYYWIQSVSDPKAGKAGATFTSGEACGETLLASRDFSVSERAPGATLRAPAAALWSTRAGWTSAYENLYSAWVEHLFDAPLDEAPSWAALQEVLSDRSRNFLFDYLGAREDEQGAVIRPDCADLPYFLRAYFAFKLGLPFAWSRCSRGDSASPPLCTGFSTSEDPFPETDGGPGPRAGEGGDAPPLPPWANPARPREGPWENNAKRFTEFVRTTLADAVQSGAGRTAAEDQESDYYPVALSRGTLRAGTIFADPYGHVLVVAERIEQTPSAAGILFAVDAQPDGTVARKRFWRGNFLFAIDPALGSAGFKRFRPIVRDRVSGRLRRATNAELPDYSATHQYAGGVEGFYDKVEDLLSPEPLDPMQALAGTIQALDEQVHARVLSVENGRKFLAGADGGAPADMPEREKIFETTGPWEDYSTPSRDLRLLVAIDVARGLPQSVVRRPYRFRMPGGRSPAEVSADLQATLDRELRDRTFAYVRSDGSEWRLSLSDVTLRESALEVAYNPNDCVEARWGAPPGSDEASTCKAHAPSGQVAKMAEYRAWFHERRRPPR